MSSVQDNGIGIKSQYLDRIFEIFRRLHTRREFPGTGIGWAICKKIVERHNGHIWAESQARVGTTFYFTLDELVT
ncbi:ATP-binding protein [Nostoc sp. PCC 7107]|uniref:sensor histidine kinase n=1 Tax=Nostoc sp. PCC 7107 TaxID=317936 RepID=UPI0002D761F6|nr:ATP-binding protein [Nostoc sp. PCC 7107]